MIEIEDAERELTEHIESKQHIFTRVVRLFGDDPKFKASKRKLNDAVNRLKAVRTPFTQPKEKHR